MNEDIGTPPIPDQEQQPNEPAEIIAPPEEPLTDEKLAGVSAAEAWNEVVARLGELGDAISRWARTATRDPENRRKVEEVRTRVTEFAGRAEAAVSDTSSDIAEQVKSGMAKAGQAIDETARRVSAATAPRVSNALAELSNQFARAAARVDQAIQERAESEPAAEEMPAPPPPPPPPPAPPIPEVPEVPEVPEAPVPPEPPVPPETSVPPEPPAPPTPPEPE
ncbi:MAG: hypothetical protein AB2L09_09625 [Coriobacteriia bacterium]